MTDKERLEEAFIGMKNFYFTFGIGQPLAKYFQLIVAENMQQAEAEMQKHWGSYYGFGYTEGKFVESIECGQFKDLKPLKPLYAVKVMSAGEMYKLTQRFIQIKGSSQSLMMKRLRQFKSDVESAYYSDPYAKMMIAAVDDILID